MSLFKQISTALWKSINNLKTKLWIYCLFSVWILLKVLMNQQKPKGNVHLMTMKYVLWFTVFCINCFVCRVMNKQKKQRKKKKKKEEVGWYQFTPVSALARVEDFENVIYIFVFRKSCWYSAILVTSIQKFGCRFRINQSKSFILF
jgi:preprotein translocase subunit SecG